MDITCPTVERFTNTFRHREVTVRGAPPPLYPLALCVSTVELLRFGLALDHRVHGFQVGRVSHEGHCDVLVADAVQPPVIHPQVIFHIAGSLRTEVGGRWSRKRGFLVMNY